MSSDTATGQDPYDREYQKNARRDIASRVRSNLHNLTINTYSVYFYSIVSASYSPFIIHIDSGPPCAQTVHVYVRFAPQLRPFLNRARSDCTHVLISLPSTMFTIILKVHAFFGAYSTLAVLSLISTFTKTSRNSKSCADVWVKRGLHLCTITMTSTPLAQSIEIKEG